MAIFINSAFYFFCRKKRIFKYTFSNNSKIRCSELINLKMRKIFLLLFLFTNLTFAQNKASIEGKITDASGYLPGVNLII
jgi:hypothetical protein